VPDINAVVRLRITVGSVAIMSDEFIVSSRITGFTGFNCPDSFLIGWNKYPGAQQWRVFSLGESDQYLQPVIHTTTDTFSVFKKEQQPGSLFAIAPLIGGKTGQKSFTFDYTTQGLGCYIKSFLAFLEHPAVVSISAELGTLYQVKEIALEKIRSNGIEQLQIISMPSTGSWQWKDENLVQGENTYRLRVELASGEIIYSEPEKVLVVKNGNYLVWPNPVAAHTGIWIHAGDFSEALIQLYNPQGQLVKQQVLLNYPQWMPVTGLKSGLYYLIVKKEGRLVYKTGLLVK
jgi:hypothetical protein